MRTVQRVAAGKRFLLKWLVNLDPPLVMENMLSIVTYDDTCSAFPAFAIPKHVRMDLVLVQR